jgi:hypothetical protein
MAMKLSGAMDSTIMRVGRWSLLTYLTYIHLQIGALTTGFVKADGNTSMIPKRGIILLKGRLAGWD